MQKCKKNRVHDNMITVMDYQLIAQTCTKSVYGASVSHITLFIYLLLYIFFKSASCLYNLLFKPCLFT